MAHSTRQASRRWGEHEVMFVLDNPDLTAAEVGHVLGRTVNAVTQKRFELQKIEPTNYRGKKGLQLQDPFKVEGRTLVAKTCTACGELRDALLYHRHTQHAGYQSRCRYCTSASVSERQRRGVQRRSGEKMRLLNEATRLTATNAGQPYTERDVAVLADRSLSTYQAAIKLGRSYKAVAQARVSYGVSPGRPSLDDLKAARWAIRLHPDVLAELQSAS